MIMLTVSNFAVRMAPDQMSILVDARLRDGSITVPVPTTELVALGVREQPIPHARYTIPTGLVGAHYWIELVFTHGQPWQLGPLGASDASHLAIAFDEWRTAHPLDAAPTDVTEAELLADPTRWHRRRIRVTGVWHNVFESSRFAGAWLDSLSGCYGDGIYRARVVGTWIYPDAKAETGFGHMGMSPGELRAETIEILETADRRLDSLTGLLKRSSLNIELDRARLAANDARAPITFALLDLDRLKQFNDAHGHEAGDAAIREFANIIRSAMQGDVICRWAGDEIAIGSPKSDLARTCRVLEGALRQMRAMTFSAGVIEIQPNEPFEQIVARVTTLLTFAKKRGGNCIVSST
jgi:diguanylate cyclase (GGDEF)-like protein